MSKYHQILGVPEDATKKDIDKAYKKFATKLHPDKGGNDYLFQQIQEAHEQLTKTQDNQQIQSFHRPMSRYSMDLPDVFFSNIVDSFLQPSFREPS